MNSYVFWVITQRKVVWNQSGIVTASNSATVYRHFGRLGGRFTGDLDRPAGRQHLWLAPRATWAIPRWDICRVAELRGSPQQLTSSRNSWLGIWCGRQRQLTDCKVLNLYVEFTSTWNRLQPDAVLRNIWSWVPLGFQTRTDCLSVAKWVRQNHYWSSVELLSTSISFVRNQKSSLTRHVML